MIVFPNCKINLGLRVTRKRNDGYHDIETVFYPLPLRDALEAVETPDGTEETGGREDARAPATGVTGEPGLNIYGLPVNGSSGDNLCLKAWHLLKKDFPRLPAVRVHLLKNIPVGAGLGGGSADGAFMLQLLNNLFGLRLSPEQLCSYAIQLGSDCPFFIHNTPSHATGRGEKLSPIALDLSTYQIVIVNPGIHIPTAWAFSLLSPSLSGTPLPELVREPVAAWKTILHNDFEKAVFGQYPEIQGIKDSLYAAGAAYAAMSGSGSTVYGLFAKGEPPVLPFPPAYTVIRV